MLAYMLIETLTDDVRQTNPVVESTPADVARGGRSRSVRCGLAGLLGATALTTLAGVGAVHAAEAPAAPTATSAAPTSTAPLAADTSTGAAIGEVVVTARHRSEKLQQVPIAMTVIGGTFLAKTNTTNIAQLSQFAPSVQFSFFNPRNANLNIRGLGNNIGLASDGIEPGVGFYVDQVYYDRPATATFDLIDLDQVEVLRGPQGTLFGKNTTAGAISLTTAAPTFTPQATAEVSGGNYGYFQAKTSVSGPIIGDVLAGRFSAAVTTREGFLTNADAGGDRVNSSQNETYRGQLLYTPNSNFSLRVIGDYSKQDSNCCDEVLAGIVSPPNGKNFVSYAEHFGYTPVVNPFNRQADTNSPIYARQETGGASVTADWNLPKFTLTSITSWRFWNWSPANDSDFSPLSILNAVQNSDNQTQESQEFRIASTGVNRVDYTGGLYFFHEQIKGDGYEQFGSAASYFLLSPLLPASIANGYTANSTANYNTNSYAAYGQAVWHVTSRLNLTGGLRYTYDQKTGEFNETVSGGVPLTGALAAYAPYRLALAQADAFNVGYSNGDLSGQADVSYQVTNHAMAYVNYARGYKSGGLNLTELPVGALGVTPPKVIQPESIDSVEVGLKTQLFDNRVTLNGDFFWERDENYQANLVVPGTVNQYLANIPAVTSEGIEVDMHAQATRNLSIYASGTYDDATYTSYPNAPCPLEEVTSTNCNLSGRPLAGVPRWALSAGGEYSHTLSVGSREVEGYVGVDYTFRSSIYSGSSDSVYSKLPDLTLVNARAGVRSTDGRWDAYLWGKNIFNAEYYNFVAPGVGNTGALYAALGDPATYGATLRLRY